ncbi:MAG: hypothetical protein U5J83_13305 [Bryobacterales bacterium]|nr:hypothetical protein [Bryobacterales bacterium]
MRYLFRKTVPPMRRVLLVESGPRALTERFLPVLRQVCGNAVEVDVFSCLPMPETGALPGTRNFYRSQQHAGRAGRTAFVKSLRAEGYQGLVLLCANSPMLLRWKWALALQLPAKVLIANENADCYWLDIAHWRNAKSMVAERFGLRGTASFRMLGELLAFPFVLFYLLLFALVVHSRRALRLLFGWKPSSRLS